MTVVLCLPPLALLLSVSHLITAIKLDLLSLSHHCLLLSLSFSHFLPDGFHIKLTIRACFVFLSLTFPQFILLQFQFSLSFRRYSLSLCFSTAPLHLYAALFIPSPSVSSRISSVLIVPLLKFTLCNQNPTPLLKLKSQMLDLSLTPQLIGRSQ